MDGDDITRLAAGSQPDDRERRALLTAEQWVGEGVSGVGLGRTDDDVPAVMVYVTDPSSDAARALPPECEGLPVVVTVSGPFAAGG